MTHLRNLKLKEREANKIDKMNLITKNVTVDDDSATLMTMKTSGLVKINLKAQT